MKVFAKMVVVVLLVLLSGGMSQADILYSEDFEDDSHVVGAAAHLGTPTIGGSYHSSVDTTIENSEASFGGAGNKYAHMDDPGGQVAKLRYQNFGSLSGQILTLSFDFWEKDWPSGSDPLYDSAFNIKMGSTTSSTGTSMDIRLDDTRVSWRTDGTQYADGNPYGYETTHHMDVVLNMGASDTSYNGTETSTNNTFDIWLDGVLVGDDAGFRAADDPFVKHLQFMSFTSSTQDMYYDNIVFQTGAVVGFPEKAQNPTPSNNADGVSITGTTLMWDIGNDPNVFEYRVYLGAANDPDLSSVTPEIIDETGSEGGTLALGTLLNDSVYTWRVDQGSDPNSITGLPNTIITGLDWSFATVSESATITLQPQSVITDEGGLASFEVGASSMTPLTYQWQKSADGSIFTDIADATLSTFELSGVTVAADEGFYMCIVNNDSGTPVDSDIVTLSVKRKAAHWTLDESSVIDGQYADETGLHSADLADPLDPAAYVEGVDGTANGAVEFDPNSVGHAGAWDPSELSGQISLSCWVYWDGSELGQYGNEIIFKSDSYGPDTMMWTLRIREVSGGKAGIRFYNNSGLGVVAPGVVEANTWAYVCVTFDGQTGRLYIDGTERVSDTGSLGTGFASAMVLGSSGFPGAIDDIQIYNYALGDTQVVDIYSAVTGENLCVLDYADQFDLTGPEGVPDCRVNLFDFAVFAAEWMGCGLYPLCP